MTSMPSVAIAVVMVGTSILALGARNRDNSMRSMHRSSTTRTLIMPNRMSATSAIVSWTSPDTNTDGSALLDLAGYHIYYGIDAASLAVQIDIPTTGLTDYVVEDLAPDTTYYFAVSAYNSAGVESGYSAVLRVTTS